VLDHKVHKSVLIRKLNGAFYNASNSGRLNGALAIVQAIWEAIPEGHEKNIVKNQQMISSLFMTTLLGLEHSFGH